MTNASNRVLTALCCAAGMTACSSPAPPPAAPSPVAAQPSRMAPPPPMPLQPVAFPAFHETTLPNGLRMIVVEKHDLPVANVSLYVGSGTAADPAEKIGLASMAAELLTKGTPTRSSLQIAETIEGIGGQLSANASLDHIGIFASVLAEQLPLAFDLVSDVALRPTFPADELETTRRRTLSALQVTLSQPAAIAQRRLVREVYGDVHPYGFSEVPATISAIQRADLTRFHERNFRADNALLVVSGDVDAARAEALARSHFGSWSGGFARAGALVEPPATAPSRIVLVHRPGSVQSNLLVGHVGIRPDNPDYHALQVLNKIVGGGADSRLFLILREQRGWTYGAYSQLSRPREVGYFVASAEVRTEVTDSALSELMVQLRRIRNETVPQAELDAAKNFLVGSFPLRIETAGQIAAQVAQTRLLGLPVEELLGYREKVSAVTASDVQRVAREYVRPDEAVIVVVGDATRVAASLQGIAPITLLDVEGKPLDPASLQIGASTERLDASRLRPSTVTYQVLLNGNPFGTSTSRLSQEDGVWVGRTEMQAGPLAQQTEVRFGEGLVPILSRMSLSQGPMQVSSDLRFSNGRITGTLQLPEQMGGEKMVDMEVPAGTLLPGMDEYALRAATLGPGRMLTMPLFNAQSAGLTNLTARVTGEEEVTVPAGSYPAYRLEASAGQQNFVIWVRREAPHVVLKQEYVGQPLTIVLQSID